MRIAGGGVCGIFPLARHPNAKIGQAGTKNPSLTGNSKIQITNYKQNTSTKLQITKKTVPDK
jgi:hypothetical protein